MGAFPQLYKTPKANIKQRVKRRINTDLELKNLGVEVFHFYAFLYVFVTAKVSPTQLPKMLTHLAIVVIALCLDSMLRSLTPKWLTF